MKDKFLKEVDNQKELKENQNMKDREVKKDQRDQSWKLSWKEELEIEHQNMIQLHKVTLFKAEYMILLKDTNDLKYQFNIIFGSNFKLL